MQRFKGLFAMELEEAELKAKQIMRATVCTNSRCKEESNSVIRSDCCREGMPHEELYSFILRKSEYLEFFFRRNRPSVVSSLPSMFKNLSMLEKVAHQH